MAAAADLLRVAEALYPNFGNPELRSQMRLMRRRLEDEGQGPAGRAGP